MSELSGRVRGVVNTPTPAGASGRWSVRAVNKYVGAGVWPPLSLGDFESIATVTVGSGGAANIEFTGISGSYQHLQIRLLLRNTWGVNKREEVRLRLNSDTGSNYARHGLEGDGSSAGAFGSASQTSMGAGTLGGDGLTASTFSAGVIDILDYANTSKTKTVRVLSGVDGNGEGWLWIRSGLWNNASAVTTITLSSDNGQTLKQYSRASLYGVIRNG